MPRVSLPPLLSILLFFLVSYRTVVDDMDELTRNGITPSLSKSEIMEALCKLPAITLKSVRTALFAETKSKGLCVPAAAILVNRRDTAACPISAKLSHDIWTLIDCLRHNINVPRILMRNGKRDRITFEASTISGPLLESSFPMPTDQSSPPLPPPRLPSQPLLSREVFATSAVMRELNLLKNEVRDIKSALSSLSRTQASDTALRHEVANMRRALSNILSSKGPETQTSFCISAWNCRGLSNVIPYLQTLAEASDMIVIAEHWLWPFELSKLDCIVPGFVGIGCSDARLDEESTHTRGCGGVGVIWKSSLPVNNI